MKKFKLIYACLIAFLGLSLTTACSDDPDQSPSLKNVDYNKLKIGRMDLSGAVSIALKDYQSSRAIEGEILSTGLYKVDANGNISAVAVYFSTDTLGNRLEHEEKLRIVPRSLFNLTDHYLLVTDCSYYDKDGDKVSDKWEYNEDTDESRWIKQNVPYKNLLVRKSDGKIWCVDNIKGSILTTKNGVYYLNGEFIESNRGDLYFYDKAAYKFNLSSDNASFEQITTGDGAIESPDNVGVTDNGIICSNREGSVYFGWPHSGFTVLGKDDINQILNKDFPDSIPIENLTIYGKSYDNITNAYLYTNFQWKNFYINMCITGYKNVIYIIETPAYILNSDHSYFYSHNYMWNNKLEPITREELEDSIATNAYDHIPTPAIYKITPGDNPGEINYSKLADLEYRKDFNPKLEIGTSYCLSNYPHVIGYPYNDSAFRTFFVNLISWTEKGLYCIFKKWLTLFDPKTNQWQMIKELESSDYDIEYQGKLWCKVGHRNEDDFGINWLDLNTNESGFIKFNVIIPDYMSSSGSYSDGIITYSGVDPATCNKVYIYIDITTGEAVNEVKAPEMTFTTIVPLN